MIHGHREQVFEIQSQFSMVGDSKGTWTEPFGDIEGRV